MESPEQPSKKEKGVVNALQSKEGLEPTIQILKEVSERFHSLDEEARVFLYEKKDSKGYSEKLKERARLLVDLPNRLASTLGSLDSETRKYVVDQTSDFAAMAQESLKNENEFGLGVLLTHMGAKTGEKNYLEKLIESLNSKQTL
jgi:hypothetical protein